MYLLVVHSKLSMCVQENTECTRMLNVLYNSAWSKTPPLPRACFAITIDYDAKNIRISMRLQLLLGISINQSKQIWRPMIKISTIPILQRLTRLKENILFCSILQNKLHLRSRSGSLVLYKSRYHQNLIAILGKNNLTNNKPIRNIWLNHHKYIVYQ